MTSIVGRIYDDYQEYCALCDRMKVEPWYDRDPVKSFYDHWDTLQKQEAAQRIAEDAKRYRWLCTHWSDFSGCMSENPEKWLTETIDAAMRAAEVKGG